MGAYLAVSLVISIAMALVSTGLNINSLHLSSQNSKLRNTISSLVSTINSEIAAKRLSLNKIIALLTTKNNNALMTYLQNNPVITRNLDAIQKDSEMIAEIQAEMSSLESELASLTNELNALGYAQSHSGNTEEKRMYNQKKLRYAKVKQDYDELADKAKQVKISTTNPVTTYTSDIDARSQNINGGMNNV